MTRDDLIETAMGASALLDLDREDAGRTVDALLDRLINNVPSVCPSGYDWTAGDIEDWLRSLRS
jgi:hypothetical protein